MAKKKRAPRIRGEQKEKYPHFRRFKQKEGNRDTKVRHPKVIMSKHDGTFDFIGLTESNKRGHHKNIPLTKNPEKGNLNPAYFRDEVRNLPIDRFLEPLKNYKLSKKDEEQAWAIYYKRKKK
ncbi:MAG: hypothetical protein J6K61_03875 [Clostridia bacterium]|nr:hypothetical protein [Clostridia bacterium]MBP3437031.1 hypothetical protein [Clostridia bacterium]